jgi:Domain of unknown function (DUF4815)
MEFNINPYNDDFEQNAKDNNYLKILFKPGVSVQARELTQIQSILQNQIKAFGDHIFQDGSPVIGGNLTLDNKVTYVKLEETYNNEDIELDQFVGKIIIRDPDGLVQAKVLASYFPSGGVPTLLIKYISGTEFSDSDVFKVAGTTTKARCIGSAATGKGTVVSINEGIFYVNGYFVTVNEQTAVVGAYSQNANVKIGLEISDDIIDYVVDSTLLDPAQGSFNYQAPGADRYQFNLNLSTRPLATAVDESSFFELMRVENGAITKQVKYPIYSEIEKTLARRTYDESGDYTVTPFAVSVSASQNANNYILNIDPGKAYVKGFEFETIGTYKLETEKPRTEGIDTRSLVDIDVATSYGNYLKFKNFRGNSAINIAALESVDLHLIPTDKINIGFATATANAAQYANTLIGTAKIRNVQRDYSDSNDTTFDTNSIYRMYMTDISIKPKVIQMNVVSGLSSNTINLTMRASQTDNAYQNVSVTVLPIFLANVPNVNTANVFQGSTRVNANSAVANTFYDPAANFANVGIGTIIRVGDDVRQVVNIGHDAHGNYLIVNTAFTKTLVGTDQGVNPLHVFKQTAYTSNVTNQTRIIERYDPVTRRAYLDRPFDDNAAPAQNTVIQLNYSIKDLESFIEGNVAATTANSWANVSIQSKLVNGDVEMFDAADKSLIFRLPNEYVMRGSLNNVDYNHTKYVEVSSGSSGVFTVALESYESIPWSSTNQNIEDNLIVIVKSSSNEGTYPKGSILKLTTSNIVITSGLGGSIQITTNSVVTAIDVYINIKQNNTQLRDRSKTLRSNTTFTVSPFNYPTSTGVNITSSVTGLNGNTVAKVNVGSGLIFVTDHTVTRVGPGDSINLYVPDVVKVRKILKGNTTNDADVNNYQDITDHFTIDYGQTDEIYDHAKIVLKQGYPSPNANLTVHVDFFEHTYPAGASYFSVDSYQEAIYSDGEVPVYVSPKSGVYFLRDCLDFRPTRTLGYADGRITNGLITAPDSSAELSFDYYLPRIDKLVLTKNKEFKILKGTSSPSPVPPVDISDAMTLYTIYLPPYASSTRDIRLKYHENRRYTMRDIARIDARIKAIEYYTSLNNIETVAMGDSTQYEDGTDKEKYGLIGEGFSNYNIADYKNPDFTVVMSPNMMLPAALNRVHGLKNIESSNVKENSKTITLNYTETPAVTQNVTSNKLISVQPFLFASFVGDVKLTPEVDYWVSEELVPEVIRGPEVTKVINEIKTTEVIKETIIERQIITTVPTPTTNATSCVTFNYADDTAESDPEDERPHETAGTPAVIVPETVEANVVYTSAPIDPVVWYPTVKEYYGAKTDFWGTDCDKSSITPTPVSYDSTATTTSIPVSGSSTKKTENTLENFGW